MCDISTASHTHGDWQRQLSLSSCAQPSLTRAGVTRSSRPSEYRSRTVGPRSSRATALHAPCGLKPAKVSATSQPGSEPLVTLLRDIQFSALLNLPCVLCTRQRVPQSCGRQSEGGQTQPLHPLSFQNTQSILPHMPQNRRNGPQADDTRGGLVTNLGSGVGRP